MAKNVLSVPLFGQRTDQWCWAACTEMITAFLGSKVLQGESANNCFGRDDCVQESIASIPKECVSASNLSKIAWNLVENCGLSAHQIGANAPTFDEVKAQIDGGRPILFAWQWSGGSGGHAMVLDGYDERISGATQCPFVHISDPWGNIESSSSGEALPGDQAWMPYAEWVSEEHPDLSIEEYMLEGPHEFKGCIDDITKAGENAQQVSTSHAAGGPATEDIGGPVHGDNPEVLANGLMQFLPSLIGPEGGDWQVREPIPIYSVPHAWLESHGAGAAPAPIEELVANPSRQLLYPVYRDGALVSSITVVKRGDSWKLKSIGRQSLANRLVAARDAHASPNQKSPSDYFALHIPTLYHAFIAHRHEGGLRILHTRDHAEHGFSRAVPQSGTEVMNAILRNGPPTPRGLIHN